MSGKMMRSRSDRYLGGVCGGIARTYGWDPGVVRLLAVLVALLPGPAVLVYVVLWIILPLGE